MPQFFLESFYLSKAELIFFIFNLKNKRIEKLRIYELFIHHMKCISSLFIIHYLKHPYIYIYINLFFHIRIVRIKLLNSKLDLYDLSFVDIHEREKLNASHFSKQNAREEFHKNDEFISFVHVTISFNFRFLN